MSLSRGLCAPLKIARSGSPFGIIGPTDKASVLRALQSVKDDR